MLSTNSHGITLENIEDFTLLKLHKRKPEAEGRKIRLFSNSWFSYRAPIPLFCPMNVYCPDSMAKLSAESYVQV
jgi:hypothetical protein